MCVASPPVAPFLCLRRGVSAVGHIVGDTNRLFSAYAEVFPGRDDRGQRGETFLCLRRGVSLG